MISVLDHLWKSKRGRRGRGKGRGRGEEGEEREKGQACVDIHVTNIFKINLVMKQASLIYLGSPSKVKLSLTSPAPRHPSRST